MAQWLLTDEEIDETYVSEWDKRNTAVESPSVVEKEIEVLQELAKAQAKKIVERLGERVAITPEGEEYIEKSPTGKDYISIFVLLEDWQALCKAVGIRNRR
ncbi:MAG TPA: hypothetical protein VMW45_00630 [Dehalococcoidia bacterium]|nr:hypothetical protein [Dehalococcoidia bacterium]